MSHSVFLWDATNLLFAIESVEVQGYKRISRCDFGSEVKKDVNHFLFRCPLTNAAHREELPTANERSNKSVLEIVKK